MRPLRVAATALAALCAAGTLLARGYSHVAWPIDLLATFSLHWAYLFVGLGLISLSVRLRVAAWVLSSAACAHFVWSAIDAPRRAADDAETIRVMSFNIRARVSDHRKTLDLIATGPADIIIATESKADFNEELRNSIEIATQYPYQLHRPNVLKLSRWPLDVVPSDRKRWKKMRHRYNYRFTTVVRHPTTPFLLMALVAASPRTADDWAAGNRYLMHEIGIIEREFVALGLPFVVLGDLNGSPTGWRSRLLRERLGLVRAKPPFRLEGTWPAGAPSVFRIAIDAVIIDSDVSVASWHPLEVLTGSDHLPVVAEISIPTPKATPRFPPAEAAD
jgi:endonuclease/exonuclease/phosphatase (EEP) superfamily protein YafD